MTWTADERSAHGRRCGRKKTSGWHRQNRVAAGGAQEMAAPSGWEMLLRQLELADGDVLVEIARQTDKGKRIYRWVERKFARAFVPEEVIVALGLAPRAEAAVERMDLRGGVR